MIVLDEYEIVFVHIPKCAGTHIKRKLECYDEEKKFVRKIINFDGVGNLDLAHLPLKIIKAHYPVDFKKLECYETYAIVRNPLERFISSVSQYVKFSYKKTFKELGTEEIIALFKEVIHKLETRNINDYYTADMAYFIPQYEFLYLGDKKIIKNVFKIEDIDVLKSVLKEKIPTIEFISSFDVSSNINTEYKYPTIRYLSKVKTFKKIFHKMIPRSVRIKVQNLIYKPIDRDNLATLLTEEQTEFIKNYYKRDFYIYNRV